VKEALPAIVGTFVSCVVILSGFWRLVSLEKSRLLVESKALDSMMADFKEMVSILKDHTYKLDSLGKDAASINGGMIAFMGAAQEIKGTIGGHSEALHRIEREQGDQRGRLNTIAERQLLGASGG
jgi:hypothetical protein